MTTRIVCQLTMKVIVLVFIFIYFLNITAGLQCYKCSDDEQDFCHNANKTTTCKRKQKFCTTIVAQADETLNCGNEEFCNIKNCDWAHYCDSVGTYKFNDQSLRVDDNETFVVSCCQDDLCNKAGTLLSSQNRLSNQSSLRYVLLSSLLALLLVLL